MNPHPTILQAARDVAAYHTFINYEPNQRAIREGRCDDSKEVKIALDAVRRGYEMQIEDNGVSGWLIEFIEPEKNKPPIPRWWHPEHGWMWDAGKALRFAREVDARDYASHHHLHGKPTEHSWHHLPVNLGTQLPSGDAA